METSKRHLGRNQRIRALAMLFLMVSPMVWLTACIQPKAVFEPFSSVNLQVVALRGGDPVGGIRVSLTATGLIPGDNDFAFTDTTGFASIRTQNPGFHYIVARHALYDIGYGGLVANLAIGGPLQNFQRGRIEVPTPLGAVVTADYLMPFTGNGALAGQRAPQAVSVRRKVPGKARFIFFAEDGNVIRRTLRPDNKPQPVGKVFLTGSFNNYNLTTEDVDPVNGAKELFDDGSFTVPGGDDQIGDGVFTRVLDLPPGEHTYMFLQNGIGIFTRDPYEEFSKDVRIGVRTPDNSVANPRVLELREFRASAITVIDSLNNVTN